MRLWQHVEQWQIALVPADVVVELASIQVAVQAALRLDASFANGANEAKNPVTKVVNLIKDMQVHA